MNSENVTILCDGKFPESQHTLDILRSSPKIVCCDGAIDNLITVGIEPVAIIGDCDSISPQSTERFAAIIHRNPDQQTNDLTKAVEYCIARGWTNITILGATGKREDHTLGNISLLLEYAQRCRVRMVSDYGEFCPILGSTTFECQAGDKVSIFSIDPSARIAYSGLRYVLADGCIRSWWCGTLNECVGDRFSVETSGSAIVYRALR